MPQWMQNLFEGWPMIQANLPTFFIILVLMIGVVWIVTQWNYSGVLASKNGQIELQDRQLADYRGKLQGATPDQAKARIDALEARLRRMEEAGPRSLTPEQRQIITQGTRVPPGAQYALVVTSEGGCPDCPVYAAAFERALRDAGWNITNGMVMGPGQRPTNGIAIIVPDQANLAPEAAALQKALQSAKIDFEIFQQPPQPMGMPSTRLLITARAL
jgi:hypothetical protein